MNITPRGLRRFDGFIVAVLCPAALYWIFALSPSSYALVLDNLGIEETGLLLGEPRKIRSDEFAIWTPQVQIAVNNEFQRYNATSPYQEDLRTPYSLPLLDWGLLFKPQFLLFQITNPAHAYSFYHVIHAVAFLIGYYLLLQRFGFRREWAALSSIALFFSSFMQFWWASLGQHPAILPWVLLCFLAPWKALPKTAMLAYLFTVWMLSAQFYPPYVLALGMAGGLGILAFRPEAVSWRSLAIVGAAAAVAAVLTGLYLEDALPRLFACHNHGGRQLRGGGVPLVSWLSQFFPFVSLDGFETRFKSPPNVCAGSTLGSYALILSLCLLELRGTRRHFSENRTEASAYLRATLVLLLPFTWISIWMLVRMPALVGMPFLWHLFPNPRLFFASGLLLWLFTLATLRYCRFSWNSTRLLAFALIVAGEWVVSEIALAGRELRLTDLTLLLPLVLGVLPRPQSPQIATRVLVVAALVNIVAFAPFNPVQSAKSIFERGESAHTRELTRMAEDHPRGWVVSGGPKHFGSVLNGWGFASINHTLILPEVDFFREFFPELDEEELDQIFSRYGAVQLAARAPGDISKILEKPIALRTAFLVPPSAFNDPNPDNDEVTDILTVYHPVLLFADDFESGETTNWAVTFP